MTALPVGKLPAAVLGALLARHPVRDPRVLLGPRVGEDAAIIDMGDRCLVAKSDPVTFATEAIGWYAVHVNANDVATCGARPRWFLATILLPEGSADATLAGRIVDQIAEACASLDVTLCGGHTEITYGLPRPIVAGQMLGEVARDAWVTTAGARPGDVLLLTKALAVEGTAILAAECRDRLAAALSPAALERAAACLREPGISVVPEAMAAIAVGGVRAMHDPTEGGLATGLAELASAAGVGMRVDRAAIPVLPECAAACAHLGLDPLGLIASGSLLLAVDPERAPAVRRALGAIGVACAEIGRVTAPEEGCRLRGTDGTLGPLPTFARDEIARLFS